MGRKLINYLPEVLRNYREFQKTFEAEEPEFENLQDELSKVLKDFFVEDATESGVKRWEKKLKINPKITDTLEDRKFKILTMMLKKLPYTYRRLEELLENICKTDYKIIPNFNEYEMRIRINLTSKNQYNNIQQLLNTIVPANLIIDLDLIYNQHETLALYQHRQLGNFTHRELREDPFFLQLDGEFIIYNELEQLSYSQLEEMTYKEIKGEE